MAFNKHFGSTCVRHGTVNQSIKQEMQAYFMQANPLVVYYFSSNQGVTKKNPIYGEPARHIFIIDKLYDLILTKQYLQCFWNRNGDIIREPVSFRGAPLNDALFELIFALI